jgi:hypothetical protein
VEVHHETEDPGSVVRAGFAKTLPDGRTFLSETRGVGGNSRVGELPFFRGEPTGLKWAVGEEEPAGDGNNDCDNTLDKEEPVILLAMFVGQGMREMGIPSPTLQSTLAIKTSEDSGGDKTRKGTREHVTCVENSHASSDLFSGVEHADHVQSTWVELSSKLAVAFTLEGRATYWSFCDAEEQSGKHHILEVFGEACKCGYNSPRQHESYHQLDMSDGTLGDNH